MATNPENVLVASGGSVHVAPVGTTLPTTVGASLNAAFVDLGYVGEDGVSVAASVDVTDVLAFQTLLPIRKIVTARTVDLSMVLREWTEQSLLLAFGGGEVSEAGGEYTYTPPLAGDALYERAMVISWQDGAKNYRLVVERGVVAESVETTLARTAAADLPITFSVLASADDEAGWYLISDDPALEPAGS
jgi:hypothetical protein